MAKLKTHKSTKKRFKITKSGKLIHEVKGWRHKRSKKDASIKYRKRLAAVLSPSSAKVLKRSLPGTKM